MRLFGGLLRRKGRGLGSLEADLLVRAVAEGLVLRMAAAAQRELLWVGRLVLVAIPVDQLHILALDEERAVLPHLDRCRHPLISVHRRNRAGSTPSSSWQRGTRRCSSSCPSCRAAVPSLPRATAD